MCKATYPRARPTCRKTIKNRGNFFRHKKRCGASEHRVQFLHRHKTYSRKDDLKKHVRKVHSEAGKRKAELSAELLRLEFCIQTKFQHWSVMKVSRVELCVLDV